MTEPGIRPRVLHVTRNLPPLVGGMERLNWHIADELSRHADVHVVGPQGAAARKPCAVEVEEVPLRPLWRFLLASAWAALRAARRQRPDLVLAGSGLTAPAAWLAARACGARAAVYVHGLDVAVRHPVYRALWHPVLRRMDVVVANSRPTAALVRELGVAEERLRIVHPGVTLASAPQPQEALQSFRARYGLGDARLLLSVGRLAERKGLREFVRESLPAIVRQRPDVVLAVVGDPPTDSLLAGEQTRDSIQAEADAAGIGQCLRFLGRVAEGELLAAYQAAHIHVFPVRDIPGNPEGFGMVAIEAAAHGLPTVAFATGGIVDAVGDGQSGRLIQSGDYQCFGRAIIDLLEDSDRWHATALQFARSFSWPIMGDRLAHALGIGRMASASHAGDKSA